MRLCSVLLRQHPRPPLEALAEKLHRAAFLSCVHVVRLWYHLGYFKGIMRKYINGLYDFLPYSSKGSRKIFQAVESFPMDVRWRTERCNWQRVAPVKGMLRRYWRTWISIDLGRVHENVVKHFVSVWELSRVHRLLKPEWIHLSKSNMCSVSQAFDAKKQNTGVRNDSRILLDGIRLCLITFAQLTRSCSTIFPRFHIGLRDPCEYCIIHWRLLTTDSRIAVHVNINR